MSVCPVLVPVVGVGEHPQPAHLTLRAQAPHRADPQESQVLCQPLSREGYSEGNKLSP